MLPERVAFAQWYLQQTVLQPEFPSSVLFTDKACFARDSVFNMHNVRVWAAANPHASREHGHQVRFSVNVWVGIIHDKLIGPYILPPHLNGNIYWIFLQEMLPQLLEDVPLAIHRIMWFQHNGAPAHFAN